MPVDVVAFESTSCKGTVKIFSCRLDSKLA